MKKVLIISTSPRKNGNSEILADEFAKGAKDAGNSVEKIDICDKTIKFCTGCLSCQTTLKCVLKDDMEDILERMRHAEVIVFATPIYFYEMSGQMKTLLDRTNPMFPTEYDFRDIYLIAASADSDESSIDAAVKGLEGWIACFEKTSLAGTILGAGADKKGEIRSFTEKLEKAYEMGNNI